MARRNGEVLNVASGFKEQKNINGHDRARPEHGTRWNKSLSQIEVRTLDRAKQSYSALQYAPTFSMLSGEFKINDRVRKFIQFQKKMDIYVPEYFPNSPRAYTKMCDANKMNIEINIKLSPT